MFAPPTAIYTHAPALRRHWIFRLYYGISGRVMVLNTTFNNISVILVGKTGVNHRLAASHAKTFIIMLYREHLTRAGFELTTLVVIGIDCIGSYISNYHAITITPAPLNCRLYYKINYTK